MTVAKHVDSVNIIGCSLRTRARRNVTSISNSRPARVEDRGPYLAARRQSAFRMPYRDSGGPFRFELEVHVKHTGAARVRCSKSTNAHRTEKMPCPFTERHSQPQTNSAVLEACFREGIPLPTKVDGLGGCTHVDRNDEPCAASRYGSGAPPDRTSSNSVAVGGLS